MSQLRPDLDIISEWIAADSRVLDLGCGDGRIAIIAAQEFGAKAVGVERDEGRYQKCVKKVTELHLENQVNIIHGDLLKVDLSDADVVTLYLLTSANEKIKPNLDLYLKRGARVVSHDFKIPGWKAEKIKEVRDTEGYNSSHTLYLYRKEPDVKLLDRLKSKFT